MFGVPLPILVIAILIPLRFRLEDKISTLSREFDVPLSGMLR
jgi:hypothetical protein